MAWQVWRAPSCWVLAKGVSPTPRSLRPTIFRSWCCWDFHGNFDGTGCIWVWQVPVMLGYFNSPLPRFATKARHLRAVVRLVWLQPWQHPGYARLRDRCYGGSGGDEHHTVSSHWRHHRLHLGLCHHQEIRRGWPVQWHPGRPGPQPCVNNQQTVCCKLDGQNITPYQGLLQDRVTQAMRQG